MKIETAEREKYEEIWRDPEYALFSPGLLNVSRFLNIMAPRRNESLIDIGCGQGVAGLEFAKRELQVSYLDITDTALLPEVPRERFIQGSLWENWPALNKHGYDYGFCCDVMEHIPPEYVMLVFDRIISACRITWFQIAFFRDRHGDAIGKPLHLTVQPYTWWRDRLASMGILKEARDLCGCGVFVVK